MAFNNHKSGMGHSQPMVEINTTPLVDVMLVLLVIFIITAPLLTPALSVNLPQAAAPNYHSPSLTIQVSIDSAGQIFVNNQAVALAKVGETIQALHKPNAAEPPEVELRVDKNSRYEILAQTMAQIQAAGLHRLAFVTEQ